MLLDSNGCNGDSDGCNLMAMAVRVMDCHAGNEL